MTERGETPPFVVEMVNIDEIAPHPKNYNSHPEDELDHLAESIDEHGIYRNIVLSKNGTILAGHGVVEAARKLGRQQVPAVRLNYERDDPRALKLLVGDNEIRHLAEVDDRALTELLRGLADEGDLLGTGYDDMMLANLVMVTRPASEIEDVDAAAQWVGMPEYDVEGSERRIRIIVNFANEDDRQEFCRRLEIDPASIAKNDRGSSIWWPKRDRADLKSVRFVDGPDRGKEEEDE